MIPVNDGCPARKLRCRLAVTSRVFEDLLDLRECLGHTIEYRQCISDVSALTFKVSAFV